MWAQDRGARATPRETHGERRLGEPSSACKRGSTLPHRRRRPAPHSAVSSERATAASAPAGAGAKQKRSPTTPSPVTDGLISRLPARRARRRPGALASPPAAVPPYRSRRAGTGAAAAPRGGPATTRAKPRRRSVGRRGWGPRRTGPGSRSASPGAAGRVRGTREWGRSRAAAATRLPPPITACLEHGCQHARRVGKPHAALLAARPVGAHPKLKRRSGRLLRQRRSLTWRGRTCPREHFHRASTRTTAPRSPPVGLTAVQQRLGVGRSGRGNEAGQFRQYLTSSRRVRAVVPCAEGLR